MLGLAKSKTCQGPQTWLQLPVLELDAPAGSTTAWASPLVQLDETAQTVAAALQPLCTGMMVFGRTSHILGGFLFNSQPKELQQMIPVLHACGIQ